MNTLLVVALGVLIAGAIGTLLRVVITDLDARFNRQLVGTLLVNVVGSFLLGLLSASDGNLAVVTTIGGLGALTTFSTFVSQVECINRESTAEKAAAYVLASVILGVAAALVGIALAI